MRTSTNKENTRQYFFTLAKKLARRLGEKKILKELKENEEISVDKLLKMIMKLDEKGLDKS